MCDIPATSYPFLARLFLSELQGMAYEMENPENGCHFADVAFRMAERCNMKRDLQKKWSFVKERDTKRSVLVVQVGHFHALPLSFPVYICIEKFIKYPEI